MSLKLTNVCAQFGFSARTFTAGNCRCHRRRDEWLASGHEWPSYVRGWAERERLHPGEVLVRLLDERLERRLLRHGPYFFADLAGTTEDDEQTAIDAGHIHATRIDYVGTRR
jgi:hypothetical protein